jgi:hypothetical protein
MPVSTGLASSFMHLTQEFCPALYYFTPSGADSYSYLSASAGATRAADQEG